MKKLSIRTATADDAKDILSIYSYYVENTAITFEYESPALEDIKNRIINTSKKYPYLVILDNDRIVGFSYASAFRERPAYDWSVETTIYIAPDVRKSGLGRKIYDALADELRKMGIINMYACVSITDTEDEHLTNNSKEFHEHMGYKMVGVFHKCGYKFNKWYDMIWMEKMLSEHPEFPDKVK